MIWTFIQRLFIIIRITRCWTIETIWKKEWSTERRGMRLYLNWVFVREEMNACRMMMKFSSDDSDWVKHRWRSSSTWSIEIWKRRNVKFLYSSRTREREKRERRRRRKKNELIFFSKKTKLIDCCLFSYSHHFDLNTPIIRISRMPQWNDLEIEDQWSGKQEDSPRQTKTDHSIRRV